MLSKNTSKFLRGIGVFLVILSHYAIWYLSVENNNIVSVLTKTGRFGVAIFFMMSGYGLVLSAKKRLDFYWILRRVFHVYLPYLIIMCALHLLERRPFDLTVFMAYVLGRGTWFMAVLFEFYVLFYVVWKFSRCKILYLGVGIAAISLLRLLNGEPSTFYSSNFALLVGVIAGQYDEEIGRWISSRRQSTCIILLIGFLGSGVFYTYFTNKVEWIYILGKIICSVIWVLFLLAVFAYKEKSDKIINKVGAASLEIYLIHDFVLYSLNDVIEAVNPIMVLITALLVSLVIGELLHKFFGILFNFGDKVLI